MKFKLDFEPQSLPVRLSIRQPVLMAGSCFAEHMGQRLQEHKFKVALNPNGILFNPISIFNSIADCAADRELTEDDIFEHNGLWHSWQHHSVFSAATKEELFTRINTGRSAAHSVLQGSSTVVLTLGSAWVYELKTGGKLVGNCHKVPNAQFNKRLLSVEEITTAFASMIQHPLLTDKQVLLTVSPVRYIRDGLVENNRSKSLLLQAVHVLCDNYKQVHYFPAYEIVMDELRDYRFFETDLVHPNEQAINYVYEKFSAAAFDAETIQVIDQLDEILRAKQHRPFTADTPAHQQFRATYLKRTLDLQRAFPFLDLDEELMFFAEGGTYEK